MRTFLAVSPLALTLVLTLPVAAAPSDASNAASSLSMRGSAAIMQGSVLLLSGATELVVASVEVVGESTRVVLTGIADGLPVSATVALQSPGALSVAAGQLLHVVATSSGHLLVGAGEILAFIPDQLGAALLYHQRVSR